MWGLCILCIEIYWRLGRFYGRLAFYWQAGYLSRFGSGVNWRNDHDSRRSRMGGSVGITLLMTIITSVYSVKTFGEFEYWISFLK